MPYDETPMVNAYPGHPESCFDLVLRLIIFVGLTAYDSQKIKQMLLMQEDMGETAQKVALMGALSLYLDFINLFLYLLRFMGRDR